MRKVALVVLLLFTGIQPASAADTEITVVSRNLYLGADVGVALELIPDFASAAQFMWSQVAATDFSKRAPILAAEIIESDADVVGLQEATRWFCKKNAWSKRVVVYDFTADFLAATKAAGSEYVLASKDGDSALNIGYSIPAIPYLTMVEDPATFQPLFGSDKAACGFEIGDALLVKKSLASKILQVGNSEYEASYTIVPTIMNIYRGYTWLDLDFNGSAVRIVSTHLESLWDENKIPNSALQATQLVADLAQTTMPLIVLGDFNSDPRDPRPVGQNPGGQPEVSNTCPLKARECNAYWIMRGAGFLDAGPDSMDPSNYTWGMSALLAGPDITRYEAGLSSGNKYGFTDRLDYIFTRNGAKVISSKVIGNTWPEGSTWSCLNEEQMQNALQIAEAMKIDMPADYFCNSSDHAGVVASITLTPNAELSPTPDKHGQLPLGPWRFLAILLALLAGMKISRKILSARRERAGGEK